MAIVRRFPDPCCFLKPAAKTDSPRVGQLGACVVGRPRIYSGLVIERRAAQTISGQSTALTPVHIIDSVSLRAAGFEDSLSAVAFALCSRSASQARRAPQAGRQRRRKDDDENENETGSELPVLPGPLVSKSTDVWPDNLLVCGVGELNRVN